MRRSYKPSCVIFLSIFVFIAVLGFVYPFIFKKEGISNEDNYSDFTGFVFFTKTRDCDGCTELKGAIELLHKRFPNNIRVVDCTNPETVYKMLTIYKVNKDKLPVIINFKEGIFKPYNGFTDYSSLEDYLLKNMSSPRPKTASDNAVASIVK